MGVEICGGGRRGQNPLNKESPPRKGNATCTAGIPLLSLVSSPLFSFWLLGNQAKHWAAKPKYMLRPVGNTNIQRGERVRVKRCIYIICKHTLTRAAFAPWLHPWVTREGGGLGWGGDW